jgi:cytochrome c oxidase subunit II
VPRHGAAAAAAIAGAALLAPALAHADAPMAFTVGFGSKNYPVVTLLWALLITSLAVIAIVAALLVAGLVRHRDTPSSSDPRQVPVARPAQGLGWIYVGSAISGAVLVGAVIWTFATLAAVSGPPADPAVEIKVTGHQWWWEAHYIAKDPSREFTTANEIHIPTGKPVKIDLSSVDVIHSFWVPQLTGKTDTIPGQRNTTWLEADRPGTYRGQCTEYCGLQHAHMAFSVIAEPPDRFEAWQEAQLHPAVPPRSGLAAQGERDFIVHCGICHTVSGTPAGGRLGPDLTHLMSRQTIASGSFPNTAGYLSAWIADPQHLKPGNLMPVLQLTGPQLAAIRVYLESLK